ncbi:MAG TPA: LysR family transcriptional regulator [Chthonomonas sp.]|uniref:LysR family transcriptional regulator n=1 Tax=Chthonomonas sp. TaxID=2282153 RepID=UPI002B4B40C7|nr:LysR family transcriptional regulator [Chthonomonas sp.]HLI49476.1 LysR family transcriptional regulator [Chthonomonas sp.]
MDLKDLQLFCDLVETGSFSKTAQRNFITQSAVSQRIRILERELGRTLLSRQKGKGKVELTDAGRLLYEGARSLVREAMALEERLKGFADSMEGTVRIATVYSVGLHELPGRLKPFLRQYPQVSVHLEYSSTARIYDDVFSGAMDIGIVAVPTTHVGIEVLPFSEEPMALICPPEHPFARLETIGLHQLNGQNFVTFDVNIPTRKLVDEQLRLAGVRVRIVNTCDNIEMLKNLVELGQGISLVPEITARKEAREGSLVIVPLAPEDAFCRPVGLLLRRRNPQRTVVRVLVEALIGKPKGGGPTKSSPR